VAELARSWLGSIRYRVNDGCPVPDALAEINDFVNALREIGFTAWANEIEADRKCQREETGGNIWGEALAVTLGKLLQQGGLAPA
jgi:hypothetical protein